MRSTGDFLAETWGYHEVQRGVLLFCPSIAQPIRGSPVSLGATPILISCPTGILDSFYPHQPARVREREGRAGSACCLSAFPQYNVLAFFSPCLQMSQFIVQCLNPYRKPDCKVGRITTTEDFKHLARKVFSPACGLTTFSAH